MSKKYITIQGDMWDSIAYKLFGNANYANALMAANTDYIDVYIFSSGIELTVPDIETTVSGEHLPPWKQVKR